MSKIEKSTGINDSERYLASLANKTFLNLWSHPNVYRDEIVNGVRAGKEMADLLVVCGDNVIIFSIKSIKWNSIVDTSKAWERWYRKAIINSQKQLQGAENWVKQFPNRIFLDAKCIQQFPLNIPRAENQKIHLVLIALGAHEACSSYFNGDSGSFIMCSEDNSPNQFMIGDINSAGTYIHVMNDVTLNIIMKELDTIKDFVNYLDKKVDFVRSGHFGTANGEEDLLAYYLTHLDGENRHCFLPPSGRLWKKDERLFIGDSMYAKMVNNQRYIIKKRADQVSYLWDGLIEAFTSNMLAGTIIFPNGVKFDIKEQEEGVRYMAYEDRVQRRLLSEGIRQVIENSDKQDKNFRAFIPPSSQKDAGSPGYAFMTLAHPKIKLNGGYQQYRQIRINILKTYCFEMLRRFPQMKMIIGIATEPKSIFRKGSSEDMVMVNQPVWTSELLADLKQDVETFDVAREGRYKNYQVYTDEYPDKSQDILTVDEIKPIEHMNRQQRRAEASRVRKGKRSY